jgi:hypothetical protein
VTDLEEEKYDAMAAFVKLTLLFHSASPWVFEKMQEWMKLQEPILRLASAEGLRRGDKNDATTKRLCDLGRAILG